MSKIQFLESFHSYLNLYHKRFTGIFRDNLDKDLKLGKNQVRLIYFLYRKKEMLPSRLGMFLDMKKGSLTTLIDNLENMNLVYRRRDDADRRKIWISLTEKGKDIFERCFKNAEKNAFDIIRNKLSEDEIAEFSEAMSTVLKYMNKIQ